MSPTLLPARRRRDGLRGPPRAIVSSRFFAVIFAVNGAMIYSAIVTHTGIVSNEPYRKGLHYNERIAADERQSALGWTDDVDDRPRRPRRDRRRAQAPVRPVTGMKRAALAGRPPQPLR